MRLASGLVSTLALLVLVPGATRGAPSRSASSTSADRVDATGQWFLDPESDAKNVRFSIRMTRDRDGDSWNSRRLAREALEGLDGNAGRVEFRVRRDAGTFLCSGSISRGKGGGTFELALDRSYADALARRGIGRPTADQHVDLAISDMSLELIEDLERVEQGPIDVETLVRCAHHGVDRPFVTELHAMGYRLPSIAKLIEARDHGVTPRFIRGMEEAGFKGLDYETLLRARDHGADPKFVEAMRRHGFGSLPLDDLIRARDHGVDGRFLDEMKRAGYDDLSLDDAIRARDHGVTAKFATSLQRQLGRRPSLDEVIRYRDRGWSGSD